MMLGCLCLWGTRGWCALKLENEYELKGKRQIDEGEKKRMNYSDSQIEF